MSFLLNCPCCDAKPDLEEADFNQKWFMVTCWPCVLPDSDYLGSLRHGMDLAVCDWNEQVLNYLFLKGHNATIALHLENLEKVPAWRKHLQETLGVALLCH